MNQIVDKHFENRDLDIRKKNSGYSRFMDQKVTPDVLSFISDCILNLPEPNFFSVKIIWQSNYFIKITKAFFQKPSPLDDSVAAEYNKFIGQPLKTLAYAKVLNETKQGRANYYSIENKELLQYISINEKNSFEFLYSYIVKVLADSEFIVHMNRYLVNNSKFSSSTGFTELKERFQSFMLGNTLINGKTEINRIFPKILNPFAVKNRLRGSESGYMSKDRFAFSDLMYNRTNFRDLKKPKGVSRQLAMDINKPPASYGDYRIRKAIRLIREKYPDSEVRDQWAKGSANQVHHIFPQSEWPKYSVYLENLIKITPEQHFSQAHRKANTQNIDKNYQIQCLLAKCDSIENSLNSGEFLYSIDSFIKMLNECLNLDLDIDSSLDDIREKLMAM